jgi:hypothetical protein
MFCDPDFLFGLPTLSRHRARNSLKALRGIQASDPEARVPPSRSLLAASQNRCSGRYLRAEGEGLRM